MAAGSSLIADCRVTQAAMAAGFTQPARFSRAYRRRFGESPSTTVERGSL